MNVTLMLTVLSCMVLAVANADDSGRQLRPKDSPGSTPSKPFRPRNDDRQLRQQDLIGGVIKTVDLVLNTLTLTPAPTPAPTLAPTSAPSPASTEQPDEAELLRRRRTG
ncbi:hypothetical protein F441_21528 [Phytophthora nicotianae CJ01A1]|uniref:RxLR effector protein n=6 Tax=Phytophthora nicotianae TaxID=4792 RepID=W2QSS9_PHYN3|nr:hypothetical protein PPTG_06367 [Phytophthora nicotianae INRA-310]ETK71768.1 hypothetical protein L915_21042 [Phytophthora nicotianae]ETO60098.1 hypothetical protein F444_21675 [Phytophthora nicotianae P1976]ETP01185.1 hypothetical protein F441_21528 [Phytophthora nicotianae CJ01A1]ETP29354.1 hypothetical protein F442_21491 [Phytophthora nicotianae P10297]ETK71773.1 hypothetical protein L915_21040 [Phytophthora nicotianae]